MKYATEADLGRLSASIERTGSLLVNTRRTLESTQATLDTIDDYLKTLQSFVQYAIDEVQLFRARLETAGVLDPDAPEDQPPEDPGTEGDDGTGGGDRSSVKVPDVGSG